MTDRKLLQDTIEAAVIACQRADLPFLGTTLWSAYDQPPESVQEAYDLLLHLVRLKRPDYPQLMEIALPLRNLAQVLDEAVLG